MKKKYLKSLTSIEKWLLKEGVELDFLKTAFEQIRTEIQNLPEALEEGPGELPPPKEIAAEPSTIALYSDGGCRGNPGPGAYAFLVQLHSGEVLAEGAEFESYTTNNKMELSGPIKGLSQLITILPHKGKDPLLSKIKVITDSKYVVEGMKSWISGWKVRGWKKADGKTPENIELWQELDVLKDKFMEIEWMWVKGHAGHPQNEYCDRKANEIMDEPRA